MPKAGSWHGQKPRLVPVRYDVNGQIINSQARLVSNRRAKLTHCPLCERNEMPLVRSLLLSCVFLEYNLTQTLEGNSRRPGAVSSYHIVNITRYTSWMWRRYPLVCCLITNPLNVSFSSEYIAMPNYLIFLPFFEVFVRLVTGQRSDAARWSFSVLRSSNHRLYCIGCIML